MSKAQDSQRALFMLSGFCGGTRTRVAQLQTNKYTTAQARRWLERIDHNLSCLDNAIKSEWEKRKKDKEGGVKPVI